MNTNEDSHINKKKEENKYNKKKLNMVYLRIIGGFSVLYILKVQKENTALKLVLNAP